MKENEPKDHAILRVLYVIAFYIVYGLSELLVLCLAIAQTLLSLIGSGPSDTLVRFGGSLGIYVKQIVEYVSYASERKPFPFEDWPEPGQSKEP